jgi:hypothetical protein
MRRSQANWVCSFNDMVLESVCLISNNNHQSQQQRLRKGGC